MSINTDISLLNNEGSEDSSTPSKRAASPETLISNIAQQNLQPTTSTLSLTPKRFCYVPDNIESLINKLETLITNPDPRVHLMSLFDSLNANPLLIEGFLKKIQASNHSIQSLIKETIPHYIQHSPINTLTSYLLEFLKRSSPETLTIIAKNIITEGNESLLTIVAPYIPKTPISATTILNAIMTSPMFQITDEGFIEELYQHQDSDIEELLDEAITDPSNINCSFISTLLTLSPSLPLIFKTLNQLCDQGCSKQAQWICDLLQDHLQQLKKTPSAIAEITTQISYVSAYLTWSLFSYQATRFQDMDVEKLKSILTPERLESFAEYLDQDNLTVIGACRHLSLTNTPTHQAPVDTLIKKGVPIYLNQTPTFLHFIQSSQLHEAINYYNHDWLVDKINNPLLLVENQLVSHAQVLDRFELKSMHIGARPVTIIIEKTTGNRFCYLENGLIPHDPATTFTPVKKIEGDGKCYASFISLDHGNSTTPAGIKRLFATHAWIQLQDQDGQIYSVGKWGSGQLYSPDLDQNSPHPKLIAKSEISEDKFSNLIHYIGNLQQSSEQEFNLLTNNCACFSSHIASRLFENPIDPKVDILELNTFENRIKFYNASLQLTEHIFANKDFLHPVLSSIDHTLPLSALLPFIKEFVKTSPLDNPTKASLQAFLIMLSAYNLTTCTIQDSPFYPMLLSMQKQLSTDNQAEMVNCFYNLFIDLMHTLQPLQINHPYTLWESLKKQPNVTAYQSKKI